MPHFYNQFKYFIQLLFFIIICVFLVYFIPPVINRFIFLLFLIPIWKSKKDFFWFAFVLILLDTPGGLFSGRTIGDPYRLPIYNLLPGVSFSFEELYIIILILKGIFKKNRSLYKSFVFKKQYEILCVLLLALIVVSILLGSSLVSLRNTYKIMMLLTLYFSVIFVFPNEEDIINYFKALFPFSFVAIILQLYGMIFHQQIVALLKPGITITQGVLIEGQLKRPIELVIVLLCCFWGSFLFMDYKGKAFSKNYLILINITSFISILMTATRTWFFGFTIMYLLYFLTNYKKLARNIGNVIIGLGVFILIMIFVPQIKNQVEQSWTRLETIGQVTKGNILESSMRDRIEYRAPKVIEGFKKSTIFLGAGFSDHYYKYADIHVGYQNILLHSGVIGFVILMSFALILIFKPYNLNRRIKIPQDLKPLIRNLSLFMPTILFINSGVQFWGLGLDEPSKVMILAFYISVSSYYISACKKTLKRSN